MPLINTSVPNLIQGVSQQPDVLRYDGQCEEQENAMSSVVDGLVKRPNTRHIGRLLTEAIENNSFVHFINRSDSEKYVVIVFKQYDSSNNHTGCKMRAYNLITGNEATINGTQGYDLTDSQVAYLHTQTPLTDLKGLTIGDSTFLLNNKKLVSSKTSTTNSLPKEAVVYVAQGDYKKDYQVNVSVTSGGTSGQPSNLVLPEFTFTMTSYVYDTRRINAYHDYNRYFYKWKITGVNVTQAGSNITGAVTITVTSNLSIYTTPQFQVHVSNGSVTGVTVINQGDFQGSSANNTSSAYYNTAPTLASTVGGGYVGSGVDLFAKHTTGEGTTGNANTANSDVIAEALETEMDTAVDATNGGGFGSYFTTTREGSNVYLSLNSNDNEFSIHTEDSLSDTGLQAVYKEVDALSSLPATNKNGFKVKVSGDAELSQDDYYVEFNTSSGSTYGQGTYSEVVGFDIVEGYEPSTMPHVLKNTAVDTFILGEGNFADRVAGDDNTNPLPSFLNQTIQNIFFFKNRLGLLSNENVILSESGLGTLNTQGDMVYNFGRTTVTTLLDSDPIDVSVATSRVTNLKSAKGFQENLILFSENGQFVMKGGDVLTPKTVSITPVTNFDFEPNVDPLPLGSYIYFPFTRGSYTGLREFTVNSTTDNYDSVDVTEHVPSYLPSNIVSMAGTTSEDIIALVSASETGSVYIYKYFWSGGKKVLSAWFKFTFKGDIRGLTFIDSTLYAIIAYNGETHLVDMALESGYKEGTEEHITYLDNRVEATVSNGNSITLPFTPKADDVIEVYTKDGLKLNNSRSGTAITLSQSTTEAKVWVGYPYTMKYVFSEQLFKAAAGQSRSPSNATKLLIRNGAVFYNDSAFFKVSVQPKYRDVYDNIFTPNIVGTTTLGSLNLDSGSFRFPVFTKAEDTTITITNDSALPSNFTSAEFESFTHARSSRYG